MRILLLGEYSNLHATLAEGLRAIGHEVLVVSDGTNIYNYKRDISLYRRSNGPWDTFKYLSKLLYTLPKLRNYDIVQLINPDFISLKAERQFKIYDYLRKHNRKIVLGAFGNDWQWIKCGLDEQIFRYGDFNVGSQLRTNEYTQRVIREWKDSTKGRLSQYIANDCDAIVTCLYEYQLCYERDFPKKTTFIPLPIKPKTNVLIKPSQDDKPVKFFLGIKRSLYEYKGTNIFYDALQCIKNKYPDKCSVLVVEDMPFDKYTEIMSHQDVILDQAYSYTPAMNALEAMSRGLICVGGGEEENYEILDEHELRPIINILPDVENVYQALEQLILHPERIPVLKEQSVAYVKKHHDYIAVARKYEQTYKKLF